MDASWERQVHQKANNEAPHFLRKFKGVILVGQVPGSEFDSSCPSTLTGQVVIAGCCTSSAIKKEKRKKDQTHGLEVNERAK